MKVLSPHTASKLLAIALLGLLLAACNQPNSEQNNSANNAHGGAEEAQLLENKVRKGPHRGRLLSDGDFTLELAIFETGVPPEFRAWASKNGEPLSPSDIDLNIKLSRLGGKVDDINFAQQGDALRGDTVIYEPH